MNRLSFAPRRPHGKRRRLQSARPEVELLEARNLLSFTNVLVNNPAEDTIPRQDSQSETAIVLGANSSVVVAYNDTGAYSYPTPLNPDLLGYSLSTNGGKSFRDEGQCPTRLTGKVQTRSWPAAARQEPSSCPAQAATRTCPAWENASWSPGRRTTA
jgi:hypothetical protein